MAKATFKNEGGKSSIFIAGDSEPAAQVGEGESVTTDDERLKTALRKSGFKEQKGSVSSSSSSSSTSSSSSSKKD
jgi:hypothetical protein